MDVAADHEFVKNLVGLVEVEDKVELANVAEVSVEDFHEMVQELEHDEAVLLLVDEGSEVERCIATNPST